MRICPYHYQTPQPAGQGSTWSTVPLYLSKNINVKTAWSAAEAEPPGYDGFCVTATEQPIESTTILNITVPAPLHSNLPSLPTSSRANPCLAFHGVRENRCVVFFSQHEFSGSNHWLLYPLLIAEINFSESTQRNSAFSKALGVCSRGSESNYTGKCIITVQTIMLGTIYDPVSKRFMP